MSKPKHHLRVFSHGARRALRHKRWWFLFWLIPSLSALAASLPLAMTLRRALEMHPVLPGDEVGSLAQAMAGSSEIGSAWALSFGTALLFFFLLAMLRVVLGAGLVEVLLEHHQQTAPGQRSIRTPNLRGEVRVFFGGIRRHCIDHGLIALVVWLGLAGAGLGLIFLLSLGRSFSLTNGDGRWEVGFTLAAGALLLLVAPLASVGFDLARIAVSSTSSPPLRALLGATRVLARSPLLLGLALVPSLFGCIAAAGGTWIGTVFQPISGLGLAFLVAGQQASLLALSACRIWRWTTEIAIYQALGDPHWGKRTT